MVFIPQWCSVLAIRVTAAASSMCTQASFITRESSYCIQCILAIAILPVRLSVHLSVTWVDQSKMVQSRITKSSPSAAWKTLVSGTVKPFKKFEGGHPKRER